MRSIAKIGIYILIISLFSGKNIIITQLKNQQYHNARQIAILALNRYYNSV